jgi:hypothetical protein
MNFPSWVTTILSALAIVDNRCVITMEERPSKQNYADGAGSIHGTASVRTIIALKPLSWRSISNSSCIDEVKDPEI